MPRAIIIAGPNGAGKTTFAREFLPKEGAVIQFVNADLIAAGISPFDPASVDVLSGRLMLDRLEALSQEGADFCLETTLSGSWLRAKIGLWKCRGYRVELYYLKLLTPELAIERVKRRVLRGGHSIPPDVVVRRFWRSLELLNSTYKNLVDEWHVYNNEGSEPIMIEASEETG